MSSFTSRISVYWPPWQVIPPLVQPLPTDWPSSVNTPTPPHPPMTISSSNATTSSKFASFMTRSSLFLHGQYIPNVCVSMYFCILSLSHTRYCSTWLWQPAVSHVGFSGCMPCEEARRCLPSLGAQLTGYLRQVFQKAVTLILLCLGDIKRCPV